MELFLAVKHLCRIHLGGEGEVLGGGSQLGEYSHGAAEDVYFQQFLVTTVDNCSPQPQPPSDHINSK